MVEMAASASVWRITLDYLAESSEFKLRDVREDLEDAGASEQTARRVWAEMERAGYLAREHDTARIWHRGERLQALGYDADASDVQASA